MTRSYDWQREEGPGPKRRRVLRLIGVNLLVAIVFFILLEGMASVLVIASRLQDPVISNPVAEAKHTQYDPELGWVGVPGIEIPDLYGPGRDLTTNAAGFRGSRDFARSEPPGKTRVICSGDSFTLGYGVADEETWCAQLERLDPTLETVNMGMGGYGLGQAYLWYMRDGRSLDHSVHVLAFISDDFLRMGRSNFLGYEKPKLAIENGQLVSENLPVPRASTIAGARRAALISALQGFRIVEVGEAVLRRVGLSDPPASRETVDDELVFEVFTVMLDSLVAVNDRKGSDLVLVYLPREPDLSADRVFRRYVDWTKRLQREAEARGVLYIDLIAELQGLPMEQIGELYIHDPISSFTGAAGHYSEEGNRLVASILHSRLFGSSETDPTP